MTRVRSLGATIFCAVVLVCLPARAQDAGQYAHEFTYKPDGNPQRVNVAGDFNNWSTDATLMKKGADGAWHATVNLPEGVQHYKFVVDGNRWKNDPAADKSLEVNDNNGGVNSGVVVGPDARKFPPPQPNHVNADAIVFQPGRDADNVGDGRLRLQIRAQEGDVQRVTVKSDAGRDTDLSLIGKQNGFDVFGGMLPIDAQTRGFTFVLQDGSAVTSFGGKAGRFLIPKPRATTPDWSKHAVWYQIFPERFRNGDPSNDPNDHDYEHLVPWTGNWWKAQPGETPGDENFYKGVGNVWKRRYGGDVQGLIQSLPYLKRLGVNAIYLNPIFEADSMHKYDTTDYRHVDDNFGFKGDIAQLKGETDDPATWQWTNTDKLFLDFVAQAHAQGFKVILDGVFNHVGRSNWAFQDVLKNGKNSKYASWFDVRDWNPPIKYIAWDTGSEATDHGSLPVFKKDAARGLADGPREHVLAIAKRWLAPDGDASKGVDGFRLDVPGDIPHPFWVEFRRVVKQAKPDAYISGEIWTWAQPWLSKGDQFDAVMNYRWADAAQQFFVNDKSAIPPSKFNDLLDQIAFSYPYQVSLAQMNLFDSHDTDRFASMFVNPDLPFDGANRIQDNGPNYKPDKPTPQQWQRMEQAVATQTAFVGAPMIYYGDEAGMWSPDDPSNRQPMTWPEMKFEDPQVGFNPQVFEFYQRAIAVREKLPELQLGFFRGVVENDADGVYAFARDLGDRHAYVVINRSNQPHEIAVPVELKPDQKLVDWLDPAQAQLVQSQNDRPSILPAANAKPLPASGGKVTITLQPFKTAVLSSRD